MEQSLGQGRCLLWNGSISGQNIFVCHALQNLLWSKVLDLLSG